MALTPAMSVPAQRKPPNLTGILGGARPVTNTLAVGPTPTTSLTGPTTAQGPAQGGPEVPGTPNTSPSTAATDGLYKAVQSLTPPALGWTEIAGPEGGNPALGDRTPPIGPAVKVLGRLVRGVY